MEKTKIRLCVLLGVTGLQVGPYLSSNLLRLQSILLDKTIHGYLKIIDVNAQTLTLSKIEQARNCFLCLSRTQVDDLVGNFST
jgi:hypothetical protein